MTQVSILDDPTLSAVAGQSIEALILYADDGTGHAI